MYRDRRLGKLLLFQMASIKLSSFGQDCKCRFHHLIVSTTLVTYWSMQWQVNLLLSKWMKELEKIFYGNIVAFDAALLPEAKQDELQNVIWR